MNGGVNAVSYGFKGCEHMDAAYSAMLAASDGRIYTALCTHNGKDDAVLVAFDPVVGATRVLADMGVASGEKGCAKLPQGKVHTRMAEGPDGQIYFATHPPYPAGPVADDAPPGHFIAYDLRTGVCRSVAEAPAREAVISAALDPHHLVMVGLTYPSGLLLACDLRTGKVRNLGPQANGGAACRTIGVDAIGDAWFSREPGEIVRYRTESSSIETMTARVPALSLANRPASGLWRTVVYSPDAKVFYGIHAQTQLLFSYDPVTDKATAIGSVAAEPERADPLRAFASLAFTRAPDGRLFYVAPRGIFDFFNSRPLRGAAHLVSFTPSTGVIADHGAIFADGDRRLFGSQNVTVSSDGRFLYILGATDVRPDEPTSPSATLPVDSDGGSRTVPYQLRFLAIDLAKLPA